MNQCRYPILFDSSQSYLILSVPSQSDPILVNGEVKHEQLLVEHEAGVRGGSVTPLRNLSKHSRHVDFQGFRISNHIPRTWGAQIHPRILQ